MSESDCKFCDPVQIHRIAGITIWFLLVPFLSSKGLTQP